MTTAQAGGTSGTSPNTAAAAADQNVPTGRLEEIVVTAEKRRTGLQQTPISVTALAGDALQTQQVHTLVDAQSLIPGIKVGANDGYAQITMRGVGISGFLPGSNSAVAVNVNEVYVSRPVAQLTSLFDVSDLEALRGPQGTLYGRNATAGAINITTTRPTNDWSGYTRVSYGNFNAADVEAAVGGALVQDRLLVRMAVFDERHDGYGTNLVTGNGIDDKDARGIRGTLVFTPDPSIKATLIGEYYYQRDHSGARYYFGADSQIDLPGVYPLLPISQQRGGYTSSDPRDIAAGIDPQFRLQTTAVTGILEWDRSPFGLKSITGYRQTASDQITALDGGSVLGLIGLTGEQDRQISEELQAHYDTSRLHATGGLYYFDEQDIARPGSTLVSTSNLPYLGIPAPATPFFDDVVDFDGTIRTRALAVFGQASYELVDGLSLTAGVRKSVEHVRLDSRYHFDATVQSQPYDVNSATPFLDPNPEPPTVETPWRTFTATTPKFGIEYQATPRILTYLTYAQGFKSGSYDTNSPATVPAYAPEKIVDYEGGLKVTTLGNRLRMNLSAFFYNYTDLQVTQVVNNATITSNAASSHVYGSELENTFVPTDDITIALNLAYLHARYLNYSGPDGARPLLNSVDFSGNSLDNAPDFSGHLSIEKRWAVFSGSLAARAEGDYSSRFYFTPANLIALSQGAFAKADAFITYTDGRGWSVTGFVRNLTNATTRTAANVNAIIAGAPIEGTLAPPRTYGAEFAYRF